MSCRTETAIDPVVDAILAHGGNDIHLGLPLGLGKPNRLVNALYRRIAADPGRRLTIYTALSLTRPKPGSDLEARFLTPFLDRQFGADYPDLDYATARRDGVLPANIRVIEFYYQSGSLVKVPAAQRDYASINYTHVARDLAARGINVFVQLVARRGDRLSLSSNPDVTFDLLDRLRADGQPLPLRVGVVHPDLPFLGNDAEVGLDFFDLLLTAPDERSQLFALPRGVVADAEFALGLQASALIPDGGTLQIGIGALSDAIVSALLLRQQDNPRYRTLLGTLWPDGAMPALVARDGGVEPFARGLYGASEMVMDGFMHLRRGGVLKRLVYDDLELQRLVNAGRVGDVLDRAAVEALIDSGWLSTAPDDARLARAAHFGVVPEGTRRSGPLITFPDGSPVPADLRDPAHRSALADRLAGRKLSHGRYLHGAFYLGSGLLYDWLRGLDGEDYGGLCMTRVSRINELYGGSEELDRAQRHDARFFNTCMMQTLLGAAVSDALADGEVVSGVGGQYNFVAMAHAIPGGRSVLMLRSTRESADGASSSIVWNYGHVTIPRHLRDVVVTEYGCADLRGATDGEVVERLLAVSDARFIDGLADSARRAGKLPRDFVVPDRWRRNTPERLAATLAPHKSAGWFAPFPFGTELTADELRLAKGLKKLQAGMASLGGKLSMLAGALSAPPPNADHDRLIARMGLERATSFKDKLVARLLRRAL
jgi:acyl-CoA hydrolase